MKRSKELTKKQSRGCKALCCSCRISVSSSEEGESSSSSDRFPSISSIAHAMVQERLDQIIREREEATSRERIRQTRRRREETKFVVLVAMEKSSYDPREDFRESMEEMIMTNRIHEAKDLRRLLNYYLTMNSEDFRGIILEVFHELVVVKKCVDMSKFMRKLWNLTVIRVLDILKLLLRTCDF